MAKQLKVIVPQTVDGVNLAYDENEKVVTKEVFLPLSAKAQIERNDTVLPTQLKKKFEEVEVDDIKPETTAPATPAEDDDEYAVEKIVKYDKPRLQAMYKAVVGEDADPALTRRELAVKINEA